MKKYSFIAIIPIIILFLSASSCKKDNMAATQEIQLHFHNVSGNSILNYNSTYTTSSGQIFQLTEFRYYMSGISLIRADGTKLPFTGKYLLVSPTASSFEMGKVPVGDYKGIEFSIGVDSATNHSDPATYDASSPLSIQSPPNHWDWNSGYIFVKMEGTCDTTAGGNTALNHSLIYHLGLDQNLRKITINTAFTVGADNEKILTIVADINKYLAGADFTVTNTTHTFDNPTFATRLADNLQSMFSIQ